MILKNIKSVEKANHDSLFKKLKTSILFKTDKIIFKSKQGSQAGGPLGQGDSRWEEPQVL